MFLLSKYSPLKRSIVYQSQCLNHQLFVLNFVRSSSSFNEKPSKQTELVERLKRKKEAEGSKKKFKINYEAQENNNSNHVTFSEKTKLIDKREMLADFAFDKLIKDKTIKETDRIKLMSKKKEFNERNKSHILDSEKEYLNQASFTKHSNLDTNGLKYLSELPSLSKTSVDPKHLTILHTEFAERTANILNQYTSPTTKRLFIEMNPGVGLVTKKLLEKFEQNKNDNNRLIVFESSSRFRKYLDKIKREHDTKLDIYSYNGFNDNLTNKIPRNNELHLKCAEFTKTHSPIIYGIKPWHSNAYVFGLFSGHIYETKFFKVFTGNDGYIPPEFLLYLPKVDYARFNLYEEKKYFPFACRYTVLARLFTKTEILAEETVDHFFPYAIAQNRFGRKFSVLDQKKMYLFRMKFHSNEYLDEKFPMLSENKILFNTFIMQVFIRPSMTLRDFISSICKDATEVFKDANKYNGFVQGGYKPINTYHPLQFYAVFMSLLVNKHFIQSDITLAEKLSCRTNLKHKNLPKYRRSDIKDLNQSFSGQLQLPDKVMNYRPSIEQYEKEIENNIEDRIFGKSINKDLDLG